MLASLRQFIQLWEVKTAYKIYFYFQLDICYLRATIARLIDIEHLNV